MFIAKNSSVGESVKRIDTLPVPVGVLRDSLGLEPEPEPEPHEVRLKTMNK
jgi:hypothetical protein